MEHSRSDLASKIDALARADRATVTETRTELALYQLDGAGAREVVALLAPAGFALLRLADEGSDLRPDELDDDAIGIELLAAKPLVPDGVFPILTLVAFEEILVRPSVEPIIWVQRLDRAVETVTVAYVPWEDARPFTPEIAPPDPMRVVRVLGTAEPIEPVGRWLLRDPDADVAGPLLVFWRERCTEVLSKALAQEIERDGRLLFRGPPPTRFRCSGAHRIEINSLAALQRATAWVYESSRELENRHGLLAAEISRTSARDGDLSDLGAIMPFAIEGARIAYGFGLSQQSRDALKSLSDLRKAVSDETTKLSDATRSLAAAVMASAVGNVAIVIARLTLNNSAHLVAPAAAAIGFALAIYVCVVIWSGWHFLTIQQDLRRDWRARLYRFLGDDEYERMVTAPVHKAEGGFKKAAVASGAIALLMLVAVLIVVSRS